jgi:beta-glucanase (GH16 family)
VRFLRTLHGAAIVLLGLLAGKASAAPTTPPVEAPTGWTITFHDEFDTLDLFRWQTKYPWNGRSMNNEMEMYVDPSYAGTGKTPLGLNPFSIQNGILTIRADHVPAILATQLAPRSYTSGLLTSYGSFSQLYGYFEMRAQLPLGRGLWPAFWLLPVDITWPPEIDIFEALMQQPTTIYTTVHMSTPWNPQAQTGFATSVADMTTSFHSYGVLWTPNSIAWYFDNRRIAYTATPPNVQKPMYLLVNLAVGGTWPGSPDATTKFPANMLIDYIRAYALPKNSPY